MRIVNSNLALQGSSYTATASSSYYSREVIRMKVADISSDVSQVSQTEVAKDSQSWGQGKVGTRIRAGDGEKPAVAEQMGKFEGREAAKELIMDKAASGTAANPKGALPGENQPEGMPDVDTENFVPVEAAKVKSASPYDHLSSKDRIRLMVLEQLLARLTGSYQKFKCQSMNQTVGYTRSGQAVVGTDNLRMVNTVRTTFATETVRESSLSFSAKGSVETADGQKIELELNFNFSQSVRTSTSFVSEVQEKLVDPLVINFAGEMPEFDGNKMLFDIDCDGKLDNIFAPAEGSGFLALDKNGNGKVDDGRELFGPNLGDGYKELARFDEDRNGWIDENDSIFENLKIWSTDAKGQQHLVAIQEKGIGAIYLGFAKTEMNLYAEATKAGKLQKSGLVLLEGGGSRVMQEMDLRI